MPTIPFLELQVNQACNLSCKGCSTFSDLKWNGYFTWDEGRSWLEPWIKKVELPAIGYMGGEPLLNPTIKEWITGVHQMLPYAQQRFVTNGTLLQRHWDVFHLLRNIGNSVFKITYHLSTPALDEAIDRILNDYSWETVNEFGIDRYVERSTNFRLQINKPDTFVRVFKNNYNNMAPFDSNPVEAFNACCQQRCPLLYKGKIYKCGHLAYLPELLDRFNRPNYDLWEQALGYGHSPNDNMDAFAKNFGKPHKICKICPTLKDTKQFVDHKNNVKIKSKLPIDIIA